jgi:hypothetical protein
MLLKLGELLAVPIPDLALGFQKDGDRRSDRGVSADSPSCPV